MQRETDRWRQHTMRFVVLACLALAACARPPDEVRIRDAIGAMQKAAEARHADGVLAYIGDDFTGQAGEVNREGLARMLKLEFLRKDGISVALGAISVEIDGDRAIAKFYMTLGDRSQRWLPSGTETYAVVTGWRREAVNGFVTTRGGRSPERCARLRRVEPTFRRRSNVLPPTRSL